MEILFVSAILVAAPVIAVAKYFVADFPIAYVQRLKVRDPEEVETVVCLEWRG